MIHVPLLSFYFETILFRDNKGVNRPFGLLQGPYVLFRLNGDWCGKGQRFSPAAGAAGLFRNP
jgi:hypothetical protein